MVALVRSTVYTFGTTNLAMVLVGSTDYTVRTTNDAVASEQEMKKLYYYCPQITTLEQQI